MVNLVLFDSFLEALAEGKHNLANDQLRIALTNVAPVASDSILADIVQIDYANCSGRNVVVVSSASTAGVYKFVCADLSIEATGDVGPFRYLVLYNDSSAQKELIGRYDRGAAETLTEGESIVVDWNQATGVLKLASA